MNSKVYFLLLLILGFVFFQNTVYSQISRYKVVKTNLLPLFMRGFGIGFERELANDRAENFQFNTSLKYLFNTENNPKDYLTYFGAVYERRSYLKLTQSKITSHDGLFVGPYFKGQYLDINQVATDGFFGIGARNEINFKAYSIGTGFSGGIQSHIRNVVFFEMYGGIGILFNAISSGTTKPSYFRPEGRLNISVGYIF